MSIFDDKYFFELLQSLSQLIDMPICICDEDFNIIQNTPLDTPTVFCDTLQKKYPEFFKKCRECDMEACKKCKKTKTFTLYRCHAGLVEAVAPIMSDGSIVGYIMFGQNTDMIDKGKFIEKTVRLCKQYVPEDEIRELASKVKYKNSEDLMAAAKILEVCANYIQLKDLVRPSEMQVIDSINAFVDNHLAEEISVERLCSEVNISRTKLYTIANKHLNGGLAAFVKEKRLITSAKLLKITDFPISEISERVGFSDYNYFSRAFRKRYNMSPKEYRKMYKTQ